MSLGFKRLILISPNSSTTRQLGPFQKSNVKLHQAVRSVFQGPVSSNSRQRLPFYCVQSRVQTDALFY